MPVEGPQYPVNLILTGRKCLVVGGGAIAARKAEGLLTAGAVVHVIALEVREEMRALNVTWEEREFRTDDIFGYRLVVTATDSAEVNRNVYEAADAFGVWVNAADDPANCSFTLPAIVRQGPVMVTIATGGHSPALSTWLKGHVNNELGPQYEEFAVMVSKLRGEIKASGGSTEDLDWQSAFNEGVLAYVKAGNVAAAEVRLRALLFQSRPE